MQEVPKHIVHARYKYYTTVIQSALKEGWDRDRVQGMFWDEGIPCFVGSCSEIYNEKAFEVTGLRPEHPLPIAKELGETTLMFLIHPTLILDEMNAMCRAIEKIMNQASK
jgi:dTDP-4-amino-4,6-dideoxygalactose transaminase